jgi:hypothetical protein
VPFEYAYKTISLKISPYTIECWFQGKLIVTHIRSFRKNQKFYVLEHYIKVLSIKSRSIEHAAVFDGKIPPEIETFLKKCKEDDKKTQAVQIMMLGYDYSFDIVMDALKYVNNSKEPTFGLVLNNIKLRQMSLNDNYDNHHPNDINNYEVTFNSMEDYSFIDSDNSEDNDEDS